MITLILRHRFIIAPVLLSSVTKHFAGLEYRFAFYNLASEYLPDERGGLMEMLPNEAVPQFDRLFSKRYFPITTPSYGYETNLLQNLLKSIPASFHGLRSYDYDSGYNASPAQVLASVICECPFENGPGARIVVLEKFNKRIGGNINTMPAGGYPIEHVEQILADDSTHPGLLEWCQWLFGRTGNVWLDHEQHRAMPWSRDNVDALTGQWPGYLEMKERMDGFDKWLKADFPVRSASVIRYVAKKIKNRPKTLIEVFKESREINGNQNETAGQLAVTI